MHHGARSVTAMLMGIGLVTSAGAAELSIGQLDPGGPVAPRCAAGELCTIEGPIYLSKRRGIRAARIDTASGCYAVALTKAQRAIVRDRRPARISGIAYVYYGTPAVKYYRIRDRSSGTGKCQSGTMLYAITAEQVTPS